MKTETVEIVDRGRGPQLSTSRISVLDVFYWLHRGYERDEIIHDIMGSLTCEEFDVVMDYVKKHHAELVEEDRRCEEYKEKRIAEQHARGGIFAPPDESRTHDEWMAQFSEKLKQRQAEKNGEGHPG